jgi:pyrroline-5-carboxylate reductase
MLQNAMTRHSQGLPQEQDETLTIDTKNGYIVCEHSNEDYDHIFRLEVCYWNEADGKHTLIAFNDKVSDENKALVKKMFDELGSAIIIDEKQMAAGTAVTSCGIAYAFEYIKAAMQAAIELGFYPHVAKAMIDQTVLGAVELLEHNGTYPDTEIYKVCTPGGITIKGLNEMTKEGFDHAVIAGLMKAAGK